jgi:hypothetical protein
MDRSFALPVRPERKQRSFVDVVETWALPDDGAAMCVATFAARGHEQSRRSQHRSDHEGVVRFMHDITGRIRDYIRQAPRDRDEDRFDSLAVELAAAQYAAGAVYKSVVDSRQTHPADWKTWRDVVPMPVSLFKSARISVFDGGAPRWLSSGTTGADRSRVYLRDTEMYDLSIDRARESLFPEWRPGADDWTAVRLVPERREWPTSSLVHMFDRLFARNSRYCLVTPVPDAGGAFTLRDDAVDVLDRACAAESRRVVLYGTSYAFVKLFDAVERSGRLFELPAGSMMVDTGGFKGLSREVSRDEMVACAGRYLRITPKNCVNEFGMSEMSSQWWQRADTRHVGLPWTRARTVDPITLEDDPAGVLVTYDLANVWNCMALQTQDLAEVVSDGEFLRPKGRARGAVLKGCSIAADMAMGET